MVNYWVRLYWQHNLPITQVLIWLKETNNPAVLETEFQLESTRHSFRVVRMWEQSPEALLESPGLLPLAILSQTKDPTRLLSQVADKVATIEQPEEREEVITSIELLSGLRFNLDLVRSYLRGGYMRESVVFQDILRQEALTMIYRQLPRRIGPVALELQERLLQLSASQLEELGEALLDFSRPEDLIAWLGQIDSRTERERRVAALYHEVLHRIGMVTPELRERLSQLSASQMEELREALLFDFSRPEHITAWLERLEES
jgi:predicted transposase YdaD